MIETNQKKLIAEIIPAVKLPRGLTRAFSYVVPKKFEKKLKIGTIVEIPFRKKTILGIVLNIKKEKPQESKYKLKSIENLLDKSLNLSEEQIKLAEYISNYYYTPISLVIKTIIPPITKKEARKEIELRAFSSQSLPTRQAGSAERLRLGKNQKILQQAQDDIFKKIKGREKILLIHNLQSDRHSLYYEIIKKEIKTKKQALVLLPESFDIYNFAKFYIDKFSKDKIAILTSELTKNQYFDQWKKIKDGSAQIIIGARQAVFAPFQNLKFIIADDEHSSSYKQWDMNPRYNGITVAEKLAGIWNAKIILSSPTPSVESYYRAKNKLDKWSIINCHYDRSTSHNDRSNENINLKFINMEDERKKGNYSVLSEKLKKDLIENIYQKKQAVIFIPRLGKNTVTKCNDCSFIAECEECKSVLVSYENYLYCARCRKKTVLIKECPKCQGQNIKSFGYGSENIEKEIKKLFENKNIKIQRLDSATVSEGSNQAKIYKDFVNRKIDILVGTQMVLKNWNMENLSVLAIMFPEIIFNQPDFRSKEKSFQFLNSISQMASEKTQVIIQTNNIENPIYELLKKEDKDDFYKREIKERKVSQKIGYPPFSQLIKLIYKDQDLERCGSEANSMHKILQEKILADKNLKINFEITKPFPASSFREYGKYRYNMIIKSACKDTELRNSLLNCVKKDWIIYVDPDSVN